MIRGAYLGGINVRDFILLVGQDYKVNPDKGRLGGCN